MILENVHPHSGSSSTWSNWNWEMLVFEEGENQRKTSQSKRENQQQTQPTCGINNRFWTRATLVGGECSHQLSPLCHLAPMLLFSNMGILKFKSFISIADDGNWIHPVEWERAAEELTWERVRIFCIKSVTQSGPHAVVYCWIVLSTRYITWLYIWVFWKTNCLIHWIEIYPVDSAIYLLNNRVQVNF